MDDATSANRLSNAELLFFCCAEKFDVIEFVKTF